ARGLDLHRDRRLHALERVVEREPHLDLEIASALTTLLLLLGPPRAAEQPAEDVAQVAEVGEIEAVEVDAAGTGPAPVGGAEAVVLLPLLRVGEYVVGALDLLEALLRRGVARVRVRVVLARELAVRLLDLVLARALRDAERPVQVLNCRHRPPAAAPPRPRGPAGRRDRRARSPSGRPR